jgi:hypothetical protein
MILNPVKTIYTKYRIIGDFGYLILRRTHCVGNGRGCRFGPGAMSLRIISNKCTGWQGSAAGRMLKYTLIRFRMSSVGIGKLRVQENTTF